MSLIIEDKKEPEKLFIFQRGWLKIFNKKRQEFQEITKTTELKNFIGINFLSYRNIIINTYGYNQTEAENLCVEIQKEIEETYTRSPNLYIDEGKINYERLAIDVLNGTQVITIRDNEDMYGYDSGVYRKDIIKSILKEKTKRLTAENATTNIINETITQIKTMSYVRRERMNEQKNILNFKNGLYDLQTKTIREHTPEIYFTYQIPHNFDSNADCPKFKEFLTQILNEEDIPTVQEFIGYCLYPDYTIQQAVMCLGSGSNGKSVLLNVLEYLLDRENIATRSLQELVTNRFAKASLYGKLANIHADLSKTALKSTGDFKMLTGGDTVTGENKGENAFKFKNFAKLIFSSNEPPLMPDDTDANFRRWIFINFPNTFSTTGETSLKADPQLLSKITTEQEMSGIINWALQGLERLMETGHYTYNKSTEQNREFYKRVSDPIAAFIEDELIITLKMEHRIVKKKLYTLYARYCKKNGFEIFSDSKFGKIMLSEGLDDKKVTQPDGKQLTGWGGVKLKNPKTEEIVQNPNTTMLDY